MRSLPRNRTASDRTLWDFLPDPIWTGVFLIIPTFFLTIFRLWQWWSA